jgi:hypothetical protein
MPLEAWLKYHESDQNKWKMFWNSEWNENIKAHLHVQQRTVRLCNCMVRSHILILAGKTPAKIKKRTNIGLRN